MKRWLGIMLAGIVLLLSACGEEETSVHDQAGETGDEPIQIVATTTMLSDLLKEIGGEHVQVEGLMGSGVDPHGYKASASDVMKMMKADIVVHNGLHLEGKMGDIFDEFGRQGKITFTLEDALPKENVLGSEDESLVHDPHIWFSVQNWKLSAEYIANQLSEVDEENEADYRANNERYQKELDELSAYITSRIEEVPEDKRYLVTAHDAFNYFGKEFGFEVVGLQGLNTQSEAGTRDVSDLAQFVSDHQIKAIFIESSVPTKTVESLQAAVKRKNWEVGIGGELYSDSLGDKAQQAETYIKMYRANIDTIVDALK